jgi:hypothetical protein
MEVAVLFLMSLAFADTPPVKWKPKAGVTLAELRAARW